VLLGRSGEVQPASTRLLVVNNGDNYIAPIAPNDRVQYIRLLAVVSRHSFNLWGGRMMSIRRELIRRVAEAEVTVES
jgi:hypothetical protein